MILLLIGPSPFYQVCTHKKGSWVQIVEVNINTFCIVKSNNKYDEKKTDFKLIA